MFASKAEQHNFDKLSRRWGQEHRLYHNLPFLNVLNTDNLELIHFEDATMIPRFEKLTLSDVDHSRLKKTSIDYTLCDEHAAPIVCVDFDGLADGFNVAAHYETSASPDNWRKMITELKLRVAHASGFPYFVVGSAEFKDLLHSVEITIVDGIIGEVLSSRAPRAEEFTPERAGLSLQEFEALKKTEQVEIMGEWLEGVELESEYKHNPIYIEAAKLYDELRPELTLHSFTAAEMKSNEQTSRKRPSYVRAKCTAALSGKSRTAGVWLPNFLTPGFGDATSLAQKIAQLVAMDHLRDCLAPELAPV